METAENKPKENAMLKRNIEKTKPYKRICPQCERKTIDKHETICLECGASTRELKDGVSN